MIDADNISIVPSVDCPLDFQVLDRIIEIDGYLQENMLESILEYHSLEQYVRDPELTQSLIRLLGYVKYIQPRV